MIIQIINAEIVILQQDTRSNVNYGKSTTTNETRLCNLLHQTAISMKSQDIRVPTFMKKTPAQEASGLLNVQRVFSSRSELEI